MRHATPIHRIRVLWSQHIWLQTLLLFVISISLFTCWTNAPTFSDPDSFYHLRMTELMIRDHRAIVDFPWLPFTTLADAYVDHHLLYHVFLIPFVMLLGPIVGMKVATVILASGTIALCFLVLRGLGVRGAWWWALLLLFTTQFSFRIGLAKAPSVSFLFLFSGFYFLMVRRLRALAMLSFFFVWSYGGFLLLPILAGVACTIRVFWAIQNRQRVRITGLTKEYIPCAVTAAGTIVGLLVHPSFPAHLHLYWQQIIQIGFVNYRSVIGVGGEWYPYKIVDLLAEPILLSSAIIIALIAYVATIKKQTVASTTALVMFAIFCAFTIKSQRYVEYYVPWAILFSALSLHASGWYQHIRSSIHQALEERHLHAMPLAAAGLIVLYIGFLIPWSVLTNYSSTYHSLRAGTPIDRFAGVGEWLRNHSTTGDIVFHDDWDDFPPLFYQVTRDRFIAGLDPTFFYNKNKDLYWTWVNITTGTQSDQLFETIRQQFGARFVLVGSDHLALKRNILNDSRFILVYEDDEVALFRLPRQKN